MGFKARRGEDIRRWSATRPFSFSELTQQLSDRFGSEEVAGCVIKYKDEDGDFVTLASEADLAEVTGARLNLELIQATQSATKAPQSIAKATQEGAAVSASDAAAGSSTA